MRGVLVQGRPVTFPVGNALRLHDVVFRRDVRGVLGVGIVDQEERWEGAGACRQLDRGLEITVLLGPTIAVAVGRRHVVVARLAEGLRRCKIQNTV